MTNFDIISRPWVTEKSTHLSGKVRAGVRGGKYSFIVRKDANKTAIKQAVESIYNVKVLAVNTQNRLGKGRRMGMRYGKNSDWKKAIVTLKPEYSIDLM